MQRKAKPPAGRAIRHAGALALALVYPGLVAAVPGPEKPEPVTSREVLDALARYDEKAAASGPSAEQLGEVARLDLRYCMQEGRGWDRLEAARVLAIHGDAGGVRVLRDMLGAEHSQFRVKAAQYLAEADARDAADAVRSLAEDPSRGDYERLQAAVALRDLGDGEPARRLGTELSRTDRYRVRYLAVKTLVSFEDPTTLPTLQERLKDTSDEVAFMAAEGVLRLGDPAGKERLVEGLASPEPGMRLLAAWHLAAAGDDAGRETVQSLVETGLGRYPDFNDLDYDPAVAAYVLGRIDQSAAEPYLERIEALGWLTGSLLAGRARAEAGDPAALRTLSAVLIEHAGRPLLAPQRIDALRYAEWTGDSPALRELARQVAENPLPTVRLVALGLEARLGAATALQPLRELLGDADLLYRTRAAEAVLDFGAGAERPEGSASIPDLP